MTASLPFGLLLEAFSSIAGLLPAGAQTKLEEILTYSPMLQFMLVDKANRLFQTQRYCFLGGIDDWIMIGTMDNLSALVKEYVPHLSQDSYFELY